MQALVALGFVRVSRGVGTFVARPRDHTVLLNYAWRAASVSELAMVRATIDERAPVLLATRIAASPRVRLPRTISDISFFALERSTARIGFVEPFLKADVEFHRLVLASLRGIEVGPALYERVTDRMLPALMGVADVQASDDGLNSAHLDLAAAVMDGNVRTSARLARLVARRELESLEEALG